MTGVPGDPRPGWAVRAFPRSWERGEEFGLKSVFAAY